MQSNIYKVFLTKYRIILHLKFFENGILCTTMTLVGINLKVLRLILGNFWVNEISLASKAMNLIWRLLTNDVQGLKARTHLMFIFATMAASASDSRVDILSWALINEAISGSVKICLAEKYSRVAQLWTRAHAYYSTTCTMGQNTWLKLRIGSVLRFKFSNYSCSFFAQCVRRTKLCVYMTLCETNFSLSSRLDRWQKLRKTRIFSRTRGKLAHYFIRN